MAKSNVPADVLKELEASGMTFDENGEIVESSFLGGDKKKIAKKITPTPVPEEDTSEDDQDDDQTDDDQDDQSDEDEDEDNSGDDEDELLSNDDDDEDDKSDPLDVDAKAPKKLTLTQRVEKRKAEEAEENAQIKKLQDSQEELLARVQALAKGEKKEVSVDDDASDLRAEAAKFKQMRLQMFAKDVERDVNSLNVGANFKEIIASEEWQKYLNSSILGTSVGTLYIDSIKENDGEAVVEFFKDFSGRYLPSIETSKKLGKVAKKVTDSKPKDKPSLDDLAVPNRSKSNTPPRTKKYDYEESDYAANLEKAERGRITFQQFNEFDEKFTKALAQGRVKPSNS